jgi:DNA-binding transcriptional LysR family regulator
MHNLNDMITFARVVEAKGFSEAARRMGTSKSRLSKAVAKLEQSLGVRLLNRSTRGLSLTEIGAAFHEHCARIADEAAQAIEVVGQLQSEPRGVLKVSAPVAFGTLHVSPALADFLRVHPDLTVDMMITDRVTDLVEESYDVALRIAREPEPELVARKLAPVRRVVCATPEYFERRGLPVEPHDLSRHNCLHYTHFGSQGVWRLRGPNEEIVVPVEGSLRINDDEALSKAVLGGLGIAMLPTFIIGGELQSGRLLAVLSDYVPIEQHIYAVRLPNRHLPAKVRAFIDFLIDRFGPDPYWDRLHPAGHRSDVGLAPVEGPQSHASRSPRR